MTSLRQQWLNACTHFVLRRGDLYTHYRKIFSPVHLDFNLTDDLQLADAGYTSAKLKHLHRGYWHEESVNAAVFLWNRLREKKKYGSVGFTTYNHFMKARDGRRGNATMMGPCIQSVNLTWLDKQNVRVDAFYRTTELFKKFPADLVFIRDTLLEPFDVSGMNVTHLTCHFANLSITANYFMTIVPFLDDPLRIVDQVRRKDPRFFHVLIHWLNCMCCPDALYKIENHAQSMRVHMDVKKRVDLSTVREIARYVKKYRNKSLTQLVGDDDDP